MRDHRRTELLLAGLGQQAVPVFESRCALEYLLARKDVDPERVGITGESGGGYNSWTMTALDARIAAAVPVVGTSEFLETIPLTINAMDDLVSEPSSVFLYSALRLAKDQGLRVVVTGEANDELCCGHGGMIHIRDGYYTRWLPYMKKPALARKMMAGMAPMISAKRALAGPANRQRRCGRGCPLS